MTSSTTTIIAKNRYVSLSSSCAFTAKNKEVRADMRKREGQRRRRDRGRKKKEQREQREEEENCAK